MTNRESFTASNKRRLSLPEIYRSVVNSQSGIVRILVENPARPEFPALHIASALVTDCRYFCENTPVLASASVYNAAGSGAALTRENALWSALGEAIERYAGGIYDASRFIRESQSKLNTRAVPYSEFIAYSADQYEVPGFPFFAPKTDRIIDWMPVQRWSDKRGILLPAQSVFFGLNIQDQAEELGPTMSTGLACGPDADAAMATGLREVIERDVFMTMWMLRWPAPRLILDPVFMDTLDPGVRGLCEGIHPYRILTYYLPSDFLAPTVLAAVQGVTDGSITFGAATGFSLAQACEKAIIEACHTWCWSRRFEATQRLLDNPLDHPGSSANGKLHVAYYLRAEKRAHLDFLLDSPNQVTASEVHAALGLTDVSALAARIIASGRDIYMVNVTPCDIEALGLAVVKVFVSRTQPLYFGDPAWLPHDRRRLVELAQFWGHPIPTELNPHPHPFP